MLEDFDPIVCASHRFAHIYPRRQKAREAKQLLKSDQRFDSVLTRAETKGINLFNERTGDLVAFAKKGYELGARKLMGSHGGITPEEMRVPLIVSKPEYRDLIERACITVVPSIVLRYLLGKDAESLVRRRLRGIDPSHDWSHTERVLESATKLALGRKADPEVIRLACVLHYAERKVERGHPLRGAELARSFLKSRGFHPRKMKKIAKAIRLHHDRPEAVQTLEEKILWDSDKLDDLGLIGLVRCMQEARHLGQGFEDAIVHLERDTREFTNSMHFDEIGRIAKARSAEVKRIIELFKK